VVGLVLNKATAQHGYGYGYGGYTYSPYVPGQVGSDGAKTAQNGSGKQNGSRLPSEQPRWHGR
jgi:hypothetical protein